MCNNISALDLKRMIGETILSLVGTGTHTDEEVIAFVFQKCNISDKQKEIALSTIDDVLEWHKDPIPFTNKYFIR